MTLQVDLESLASRCSAGVRNLVLALVSDRKDSLSQRADLDHRFPVATDNLSFPVFVVDVDVGTELNLL